MEVNQVKVIECFNLKGLGLMTEIQHFENGIPSNCEIIDVKSNESWIVKKRVLSGLLLVANDSETYFECETEYDHISQRFSTVEDRNLAVEKELEKRRNGIYWYLLKPKRKKQKTKPVIGSVLKIIKDHNTD